MTDYKIINNNYIVLQIFDNAYIPFDTRNKDYQTYLQWIAEGNTPLPADNP